MHASFSLFLNHSLSNFCFAGLRNSSCPSISPQRRITDTCHWMAGSQARAVRKGCSSTSLTVTCCALRNWAGAAHSPEINSYLPAARYMLLLSGASVHIIKIYPGNGEKVWWGVAHVSSVLLVSLFFMFNDTRSVCIALSYRCWASGAMHSKPYTDRLGQIDRDCNGQTDRHKQRGRETDMDTSFLIQWWYNTAGCEIHTLVCLDSAALFFAFSLHAGVQVTQRGEHVWRGIKRRRPRKLQHPP